MPAEPSRRNLGERWRVAIFLGLVSSTFSTVISQLAAPRIGCDPVVDWMIVAVIPGGTRPGRSAGWG
jgi:hypothetical protein